MIHLSIVPLVIIIEHAPLWDESLNHGSKIDLDLHQRAAGHFMRWVLQEVDDEKSYECIEKKREK